jgi:hypothetical protein
MVLDVESRAARLSHVKVLDDVSENSLTNFFANGSLIKHANQSLVLNDPAACKLT